MVAETLTSSLISTDYIGDVIMNSSAVSFAHLQTSGPLQSNISENNDIWNLVIKLYDG